MIRGVVIVGIIAAYLTFELYGLHANRYRMEPAFVFDEFVGAQRAVQTCGALRPGSRDDFERNFAVVRRRTRASLQSGEESARVAPTEQLLLQEQRRVAAVDALIAKVGCDDPEVWKLRKLYEIRARLSLR